MNRHNRRAAAKHNATLNRADAIRAAVQVLGAHPDPTVSGATLILPDGESLYLDADHVRAMNDSGAPQSDLARDLELVRQEGGGLLRVYFLAPSDAARLLLGAAAGDAWSLGMLRAVGDCIGRIAGAPKRAPMLCLVCPRSLRKSQGVTFCVAVAETEVPHHALGSAICPACAARPDLERRVTIALRKVWPDLRAIEVMPGPETVQ